MHDPIRHRYRGELLRVPHRVAGGGDQAGRVAVDCLESTKGAEASAWLCRWGVDDDLDLVLPADGEVLLEHGDGVEFGGRTERVVEHLHAADPIDSVRTLSIGAMRPAQQVPATVTNDDSPRIPLGDPLRPGLGPIVKLHPLAVGACLHERGRDRRVGSGGSAVGAAAVIRRTASACAATGVGSAHDLAERTADGSIASLASWWLSSTAITRPSASSALNINGGAVAAPDAVATVRPSHRVDRHAGFAQDADIPADCSLRDRELVGEPVRSDTRAGLDQFECQQRARAGLASGCKISAFRKWNVRNGAYVARQ